MWRAFYSGMATQLPLLAMFIFITFFVLLLVWLAWRGQHSFDSAASLPLGAEPTTPLKENV